MNNMEKYMNDPDIANEPMALREVHAIRLMLQDEMKNMTAEERSEYTRKSADRIMEEYGLTHLRIKGFKENGQGF